MAQTKKSLGRLKIRSDFLAVKAGEKRRGTTFLLEVLNRQIPEAEARIGFTVTKKQGNAVERNRMRRRLKEAVRLSSGFAMKPGHDYVIIARRDVLDMAFPKLQSLLTERIEGWQNLNGPRRPAPGKNDEKKP